MRKGLIAAVFLVALLQGCAGSESKGPELLMWLVGSEAQARTINELAESFTRETGVAVRCEAISWGEAHSKYLTAVAGGVEPDIGTMGLTWGSEFGRLGALVDLKEAFPEQLAVLQAKTFAGLLESIEQDGKVYGVPLDVSLQLLYYRTDIISEVPTTWSELTQLLQSLEAQGKRMVIEWGNLSWIGFSPFLWQAGGHYFTADKTATALDTREAINAASFFRDLYNVYNVPRAAVPLEQGMRTGDFPIAYSGNWKMVSLDLAAPEIKGKWSIAGLPAGPSGKGTSFLGGRIMGIFSRSPNKEAAWRFMEFLFSEEVQKELYEAGWKTEEAYLPSNIEAWPLLPMDAAMKSAILAQANDAKGPPSVRGWNAMTHEIEDAVQRIILEGGDPAEEFRKTNEVISGMLGKD